MMPFYLTRSERLWNFTMAKKHSFLFYVDSSNFRAERSTNWTLAPYLQAQRPDSKANKQTRH